MNKVPFFISEKKNYLVRNGFYPGRKEGALKAEGRRDLDRREGGEILVEAEDLWGKKKRDDIGRTKKRHASPLARKAQKRRNREQQGSRKKELKKKNQSFRLRNTITSRQKHIKRRKKTPSSRERRPSATLKKGEPPWGVN